MKNTDVITLEEADERFGLRSLFDLDKADDDEEIVLFAGPTALEYLPLDFFRLDSWSGLPKNHPNAFLGCVVDGDLTVTGSVTNHEWDFGPLLLVRGDVRAKNFATAGSQILIEGNLEVTQTVAGTYNHGRTVIKGDARAEVVVTDEHLIQFQGSLDAELVVAGNFLEIADPERTRVNGWAGYVCDLQGKILRNVGSESTRALRVLDPEFWDLDSRKVLTAMEAGRSLLRAPEAQQIKLHGPKSVADTIREILRQAGCPEKDRWDDGFVVHDRRNGEPIEVYFCEADEPDEPDEPEEPEVPDSAAELRRCAEALTTAGYRVTADPEDADVLLVR